jgi:hypothetical protein
MSKDWRELTRITQSAKLVVERVRLVDEDITIEGSFDLPLLASLAAEDQVFVAAFVRCHGSIKQMEQWFGVSYPTIKNRLNRIGHGLGFVEENPPEPSADVLGQLERGEITVEEALEALRR